MANPPEEDPPLEAIDKLLLGWQQGDCVLGEHWFSWRFAPDLPITEGAKQRANESVEDDIANEQCPGFAIVTQTCDIVRPCQERPFLEVCPLVGAGDIRSIRDGKRPRYAYLAGLESMGLVVELDRVMTVEKPVLVRMEKVRGCLSDQDQRNFAESLARKRDRFAFPDDFTRLVKRLRDRICDKHGKESDEGEALRHLREIRVYATPSWEADEIEILFYFIKSEDAGMTSESKWAELLDKWLKLVHSNEKYIKIEGFMPSLMDMSASEYVYSDRLDLNHMSIAIQQIELPITEITL